MLLKCVFYEPFLTKNKCKQTIAKAILKSSFNYMLQYFFLDFVRIIVNVLHTSKWKQLHVVKISAIQLLL